MDRSGFTIEREKTGFISDWILLYNYTFNSFVIDEVL